MIDDIDPGFFAAPPFKADDALVRLRRDLRDLGLTEREGQFEWKGQAVARAMQDRDSGTLLAAIAKRPAHQPDWQSRTIKDSAQLRDFVTELKKRLGTWREDD